MWRRASLPRRHISQRLWLPGGFCRLSPPRGWVARTELERVLFPLEKAKAQASLEPKSRGPSTARRRRVSGGLRYGIATKLNLCAKSPRPGLPDDGAFRSGNPWSPEFPKRNVASDGAFRFGDPWLPELPERDVASSTPRFLVDSG